VAWSPGGDAEFDVTRGALSHSGQLSTGDVSGLRIFGEVRFDDLLLDRPKVLAFTPRFFCDQALGSSGLDCGFGAEIELSNSQEGDIGGWALSMAGEKTGHQSHVAASLQYARRIFGGNLSATAHVSRGLSLGVQGKYDLSF
jgi:hypothetical protein